MNGFYSWYFVSCFFYGYNARIGLFEVTSVDKEKMFKLEELASQLKWDFWKPPEIGIPIRFTTESDADNIRYINSHLSEMNLTLKVVDENLDQTLYDEIRDNSVLRAKTKFQSMDSKKIYTYFASHEEYNQWLLSLESNNADFLFVKNIGKSYEGRDMLIMKLSLGSGKESVFIDGGIHAREWLAISSVVWILNKLVVGYKNGDPDVIEVLKKFDIYILPVTNPDGYELSRLKNRLWRKNTMPVGEKCIGVDLNRNFDSHFGGPSESTDPCNPSYPGLKAFSAPETINFRDFVLSIKDKLQLFISFHSFGQFLLTPWGYTKDNPSDYEELLRVAKIMVDAIFNVSNVSYKIGSPANILYVASGGSLDWVKEENIKYSYTFEVRPSKTEKRGFVSPTKWIKPTGEELYAGFIAAMKAIQ